MLTKSLNINMSYCHHLTAHLVALQHPHKDGFDGLFLTCTWHIINCYRKTHQSQIVLGVRL